MSNARNSGLVSRTLRATYCAGLVALRMSDRWLAQGQGVHDSLKCPACELLLFDVLVEDRRSETTTIDLSSIDLGKIQKWALSCDLCRALIDLYGH